jgi:hypothetical protein
VCRRIGQEDERSTVGAAGSKVRRQVKPQASWGRLFVGKAVQRPSPRTQSTARGKCIGGDGYGLLSFGCARSYLARDPSFSKLVWG